MPCVKLFKALCLVEAPKPSLVRMLPEFRQHGVTHPLGRRILKNDSGLKLDRLKQVVLTVIFSVGDAGAVQNIIFP